MTRPISQPSIDDAARALALHEDRGGSVLATGSTVAERAAWLSACAAAVAGSGAPLVVRVRGPAENSMVPLADELAAAVESALVAAGAPGGLYDEGAGPLGALGGWLFRARTARRHGLLLVFDEVDGWLEARGSDAGGAGAAGAALIERCLRESERRPLSVLAGVRGADAAGEAAVSAALAAKFGHVVRLGGSATVTRDPMTLVTALAGRTFSLRGLKSALAGWLDVPDEDDTVLVFSTPQSVVEPPAPGPAREPAPEPAPEPEATASEGDSEVAWSRAERALTPREGSPAAGTGAGAGPVAPEGWGDALRAAVEVRDALADAARLGAPRSFRQYERAFREAYARLPLALAALGEGERSLGMESSTTLRRRGSEALANFERSFAQHYQEGYEAWLAGAPRPAMLCDLPGRVARLATERGARGTAVVLFTGLRLDAWRRLRDVLIPRLPRLVLLEEGAHWAARPTTPATQRELLARGLSAMAGQLPRRDEPVAPRTMDEALAPRREHLGLVEVLRVDAYAAALTRSDAALPDALGAMERALPGVLLNTLGSLPPRTVVALAGDVGVREVRRRPDERERGRHAYGGDSPFEAIVPYAVFEWS